MMAMLRLALCLALSQVLANKVFPSDQGRQKKKDNVPVKSIDEHSDEELAVFAKFAKGVLDKTIEKGEYMQDTVVPSFSKERQNAFVTYAKQIKEELWTLTGSNPGADRASRGKVDEATWSKMRPYNLALAKFYEETMPAGRIGMIGPYAA